MVPKKKAFKIDKIFPSHNIMENLKDAIDVLGDDMSRQYIKGVYDITKGIVNIKYKDVLRKESRPLLKQLLESKLKELKKHPLAVRATA